MTVATTVHMHMLRGNCEAQVCLPEANQVEGYLKSSVAVTGLHEQ